MAFTLHPQLEADSAYIGHTDFCQLRLMNSAHLPWLLLIPERNNIHEVFELNESEQAALWRMATKISHTLRLHTSAEKMNVAALGNVVPQLHVHIIARFKNDPAWPKPVWGNMMPKPYNAADLTTRLEEYRDLFGFTKKE